MEAFLHSSLGSSLCAEYDNLVRSARKITHAGKEHHLHAQKKLKNCKTGKNIESKDCTIGAHVETHTCKPPVGVTGLLESERQSDWLSKTPDCPLCLFRWEHRNTTISKPPRYFVLISLMKNISSDAPIGQQG